MDLLLKEKKSLLRKGNNLCYNKFWFSKIEKMKEKLEKETKRIQNRKAKKKNEKTCVI